MQRLWQRLGALPYLILGATLLFLGLYSLRYLVNNIWLFDVGRLDLVRAVAQDRTDAPALLNAAYSEVILAFLAAVAATVVGFMLPLTHYLNKRFATSSFYVNIRQSVFIGLWVAFCVWLQMNRALGVAVALLAFATFALIEVILQIRARAQAMPFKMPSPKTAEGK